MSSEIATKKVEEGALIRPAEVRILAAVVYQFFTGAAEEIRKGEVLSYATGHYLWLEDDEAAKDSLRVLGLIDEWGHTSTIVEFRYASMPLEIFYQILAFRESFPILWERGMQASRSRSRFTASELARWARRKFFDMMNPYLEDPLAFPHLWERIERWRHPIHGFDLTVRFITEESGQPFQRLG